MRRGEDVVRFVTNNEHKYKEASDMLSVYNIKLEWVPLPVDEIQSEHLEDIVVSKVVSAIEVVDPPFIVEDTGLFIHALNGFPGVYASYVYEKLGLLSILKLLEKTRNRKACFVAVGALVTDKHIFKIFRGKVCGEIAREMRGSQGFGYDPIFIPEGYDKTMAEMSREEKNRVSHRGRLFTQIGEYLARKKMI